MAIIHERDGMERPAIWHVLTDELIDIHLDLPGPVDVADWWPDGSALLLQHNHDGRSQLYRFANRAPASCPSSLIPKAYVSGAAVRSIGEVWFRDESATRSTRRAKHRMGGSFLAPPGDAPPAGVPIVTSVPGAHR